MPDPFLESVYSSTDYHVVAPAGQFTIRVGEPCPLIDADSWAFVTACNPGSRPLAAEENAERLRQLEREVVAAGFAFRFGAGVGRDGAWPPEPSLLVLNISEQAAAQLARRFGQSAIVFARRGEPARLVWIDD